MTTNGTEERPLPDGWIWTTVDDIANVKGGKRLPKGTTYADSSTSYPYVRVKDFTDAYTIDTSDLKFIDEVTQEKISKYTISKDDVYISIAGTIGKVGTIPEYLDGANLTENAAKITDLNNIHNRYLTYALSSDTSRKQIDNFVTSSNQPKLALFRIAKIEIPLAPLPEQERIVAEIEKQFTRLDQAVASLRRLNSNLARYKASVLKAACEGRLVPQDPADEPAGDLLERILAERRAQWQAANPGKKYKEPVGMEETAELPDLPDGWVWARFEQLLRELKNGYFSKAPDSEPPGIPILRISAVRSLSVDLSEPRFLRETMSGKIENYLLKNNDLLFTRYNGNLYYVGVCGVVRNLKEATIYPDKLIRARVASENILPSYLEIYFGAPFARRYIEQRAKSTAGQHGIAGGQLLSVPVMVPPLAEQERIVAEVERRLSVVSAVEQTIAANLSRAERLRQSILHRAFTGQLVPQEEVA